MLMNNRLTQSDPYRTIISLGFFCGVAKELKRFGLRKKSFPFDWLITDGETVIEFIANDFSGFLDEDSLVRDAERPDIIHNTKYKTIFLHDFPVGETVAEHLPANRKKYQRRIERFYRSLRQGALCVRYIADQKECDYWESNLTHLLSLLQQFNEKNEVLFIANSDVNSEKLYLYSVDKIPGGLVADFFINSNKRLFEDLIFKNLCGIGKIKARGKYLKQALKQRWKR
jgi:Putative papain-like cysteine peptidase (DUF1796)